MKFFIRKSSNLDLVTNLHKRIFPNDELPEIKENECWIAYDERWIPIGFTTLELWSSGICFFSRSGILPRYRGYGIHKRFIKIRKSFCKRRGFNNIITYTSIENTSSANNLIDMGFKSYIPEYRYVGEKFNYWILEVQ